MPECRTLRRDCHGTMHSNAFSRTRPRASVESAGCRQQRRLHVQAILLPQTARTNRTTVERIKKMKLMTAVKTPYLPNGKIDLPSYDSILEGQIAAGVEGVIVGGTTGEGQLMHWDEHIMLIAHTVHLFGRDLAVVGNTGSNSTGEALHATEQGFAVGMHAALQINPYYGKTSKAGLHAHFSAVLDEGPAIIYNVPGRTGQDVTPDVVQELAKHPNFLGMKECTGNARIKAYTSQGINCWSGNDDEAHAARHEAGAAGVISVTSNMVPSLMARLMADKDYALNDELKSLFAWMFCEPNPIALNTACAMCGLAAPVFRLPYVPLNREQRERGAVLLQALQQSIPGCKEVRIMEDSEFKVVNRTRE